LHADGTGGAFQGADTAAFAVAVINSHFIAVNDSFRTVHPAQLAFAAGLHVNHRAVSPPGTSVAACTFHRPGNGPVGFGN